MIYYSVISSLATEVEFLSKDTPSSKADTQFWTSLDKFLPTVS